MWIEVLAALLLGVTVLLLVLQPLFRPASLAPAFEEPEDPEETRRGIALIALKEIDFDKATGKLSDADYEFLKSKYTAEALAAIREEAPAPVAAGATPSLRCARCGAHPEPGARFCTACGEGLATAAVCRSCQAPVEPGSRFCTTCGTRVAA
ncbi:MAG TPA: zinc ribbon domain-containing protein [Gemmatimonadales bacterium]